MKDEVTDGKMKLHVLTRERKASLCLWNRKIPVVCVSYRIKS